jgi:chromosome segregation ATPase
MKITSFLNPAPPKSKKRLAKTASGVRKLVESGTSIKLTGEVEELKAKLQLSQALLEEETSKHLKGKEGFSISKKAAKESGEQLAKTTDQCNLLALDVKTYQEAIAKQNTVVEELKGRISILTPIENTHKEFQIKYFENVGELQASKATATALHGTKDLLEDQVRTLSGYKKAVEMELEQVKTEYNSMCDSFSTLEQTNLGLKSGLEEARRDSQILKNGFTSLEQENANLVSIKTNLTSWLEDLKGETASLADKKTFQERELQKAKTTIKTQLLLALTTGSFSEMGEVLGDLIMTNANLQIVNKQQLAELNRPRYLSAGSISKQDGFKFPSQFNVPKNSLGSSKPTLLKVRQA